MLSWNLFHGRDFPPDPALRSRRSRLLGTTERNASHLQLNRSLRSEFAGWLGEREWELALLQEAPPRWLGPLAARSHAAGAGALTSRNFPAFLRAAVAERNPDLIASGEGGSNQLLVRRPWRIAEVRRLTLTLRPERRRMLWARLEREDGAKLAVGNLHATAGDPPASLREVDLAAERAAAWAGGDPLMLGGDFNLRTRRQRWALEWLREAHGLAPPTPPDGLDHLLVRGLDVVEAPAALAPEEREIEVHPRLRVRLSDHAPVMGTFGVR